MRFARLQAFNGLDRTLYLQITPYLVAFATTFTLMAFVWPGYFLVSSRYHLIPLLLLSAVNGGFTFRARMGDFTETLLFARTGINSLLIAALFFNIDPSQSRLWPIMLLPIMGHVTNANSHRSANVHFAIIMATNALVFAFHCPFKEMSAATAWALNSWTRFASIGLLAIFTQSIRSKGREQNRALLAAYNKLAQNQKQIAQTERFAVLGEMSAGVAHEINNAMTSMVCGLDDLNSFIKNQEPSWAAMGKHIERMSRSSERIQRVVSQLRMLARDPRRDPAGRFDLCKVIDNALDLTRPQITGRGIDLEVRMPHDPVSVFGHESEICQVLLNLLNNARDALEGAGSPRKITVSISQIDHKAVMSVEDTGPGIPEEVLKRMYKPFVTTKPSGRGTGLGLSISLGIVKRHGGNMTFETARNRGTKFSIELPLASQAAAA